jgi:hypothetical protein
VAANLPLGPQQRQQLLEAGCAAQRLRAELQLLRQLRQLRCACCGARLAASADVFSLTPEGVGGAFVNAHGYVHDMVRACLGVRLRDCWCLKPKRCAPCQLLRGARRSQHAQLCSRLMSGLLAAAGDAPAAGAGGGSL